MNRDEAIETFQYVGIHVFAREWSLGESIGVAWGEGVVYDGISIGYTNLLYIYQAEASWQVLNCAENHEESYHSLASAVDGVLARRGVIGVPNNSFRWITSSVC